MIKLSSMWDELMEYLRKEIHSIQSSMLVWTHKCKFVFLLNIDDDAACKQKFYQFACYYWLLDLTLDIQLV